MSAADEAARRAVLGHLLEAARVSGGWRIKDAKAAAGIAPMTWRRLENGDPVRHKSVAAAAEVLGVSTWTLVTALADDAAMSRLVEACRGNGVVVDDSAAEDATEAARRTASAVMALRAALYRVERTFEPSADMDGLVDALTVAVVEAGWRPPLAVLGGAQ